MAAPKTRPTDADVHEFLLAATPAQRSVDGLALNKIFREVTGAEPVMWGPSIVGYGSVPVCTSAGVYDWPKTGFSPRKASLTLYGLNTLPDVEPLMAELGTFTQSVACVYVKRLEHLNAEVLRELIARAWALEPEE